MASKDVDYINNTVWCRLAPSQVHGVGVFAIRDIPKGTKLTDHTLWEPNHRWFRLKREDFDMLLPEIKTLILDRLFYTEKEWESMPFISPNSDAILQSFMNHSRTPNSDGEYALVDIKKGEEVTEDFTIFNISHPYTQEHLSQIL